MLLPLLIPIFDDSGAYMGISERTDIMVEVSSYFDVAYKWVYANVSGMFIMISELFMVLNIFPIMLFFLLRDDRKIHTVFLKLIPEHYRIRVEDMLAELDRALNAYIAGRVIVNIAGVPVALVALTESPTMMVLSILIIVLAQLIRNNFLEPLVFGNQLDMHPFTVIVVVLIGGELFGMVGMIICIPFYITFKILVRRRANNQGFNTYLQLSVTSVRVLIVKKFDNTGEDLEDLISIGTIGLIKAIESYSPDKGTKLATFAAR